MLTQPFSQKGNRQKIEKQIQSLLYEYILSERCLNK